MLIYYAENTTPYTVVWRCRALEYTSPKKMCCEVTAPYRLCCMSVYGAVLYTYLVVWFYHGLCVLLEIPVLGLGLGFFLRKYLH